MPNESHLEGYFSLQPLEKQVPPDFTKNLEELWIKHFGTGDIDASFARDHLKYKENKYFFFVAQEYLRKSGMVSEPASVPELERPFKGISVCTVGGIEGRVMAEMGASVVNIDPHVAIAPKIDLPNLLEITNSLDADLAQEYAGRFDVLLSSGLIDSYSGFTEGVQSSGISKYCRDFFLLMLKLLKPKGAAILKGNLVHLAIRGTSKLVSIKDIFPITGKDKIDSPDLIFVIQKKDAI